MTSMEYRNFVLKYNRATFKEICSGLAFETKELLGLIKTRDKHKESISEDRIKDECGDLLFYLISFLVDEGLTIEEVMSSNAAKVKANIPWDFRVDRTQQ